MLNFKKGIPFLLIALISILASCQTDLPPEQVEPINQADPAPAASGAAVAVEADAVVQEAAEETETESSAASDNHSAAPAQESPRNTDDEMAQLIAEFVREEGTPNQLVAEKSPYLLQHAYNPVNWHPWGEEAFAKAAAEDKPVFLSIGYSTCHWCHVMRDESFEDNEVAALMNQSFISIKVDREERPDIDNIYMNVAQITGNRGGWPLTIIMTPDQKPFFTATYIPKGSRFERTGMLDLIPQVDAAWVGQRDEIIAYSETVVEALQTQQTQVNQGILTSGPVNVLDSRTLDNAFISLDQSFDPIFGGFGEAPKFPSPHNLLFLLRYGQRIGDEKAVEMVETTLQGMRLGGVYDQIGFGFHRYSTDQRWQLPHFEKMLYDQAMLSMAYTETAQVTEDEFYEDVAREIFTYVLRDMTDPQGGFYSAEDADSEGEEGVFYFWTIPEIQSLLSPEDADLFIQLSSMSIEGNFLDEASGQRIGENIVYWNQPPAASSSQFGMSPAEFESRLEGIRQTLFAAREERIHPHKDDKILTDWNGLMIAALAKAGQAFNEPEYISAASNAADFLLVTMKNEDGRLLHRYRDGGADILANADDYAYLTWGLLELYEATFDLKYLEAALDLNEEFDTHFWDEEIGGYWFTPDDGEELLVRQKQIYDGAIPSGNSVAMLNLLRLGRITANADYEAQAFTLTESFYGQVSSAPTAFTHLLSALEFGIGPSYEVIIIGEAGTADTEAMLTALRGEYVPNKVVLLRGLAEDGPLTELADYTNFYYAIDDQATAYVCQNYVCEFPTNDPEKMVELLFQSTEVGTDE